MRNTGASLPGPLARVTVLLAALVLLPRAVLAQTIYAPSSKYQYHGCYNETTALENTAKDRALDGTSQVLPGSMTVQTCLDFCSTGGKLEYTYAGLEFSRECWCGQHLSTLSAKLPDAECNTVCDGDRANVCGGSMRLSVYVLRSAAIPSFNPASSISIVLVAVVVSILGVHL